MGRSLQNPRNMDPGAGRIGVSALFVKQISVPDSSGLHGSKVGTIWLRLAQIACALVRPLAVNHLESDISIAWAVAHRVHVCQTWICVNRCQDGERRTERRRTEVMTANDDDEERGRTLGVEGLVQIEGYGTEDTGDRDRRSVRQDTWIVRGCTHCDWHLVEASAFLC